MCVSVFQFLFNGISSFLGYWMPNLIVALFNLFDIDIKGAHAFLKDIIPELNILLLLEFELIYLDLHVLFLNHYATECTS